jgi:hypothetical protein
VFLENLLSHELLLHHNCILRSCVFKIYYSLGLILHEVNRWWLLICSYGVSLMGAHRVAS